MKNHLRLVTSNDEPQNYQNIEPPPFPRERFLAMAGGFGKALRYTLFLLLVFVRIPIHFVGHLILGPLIFFAIVWGYFAGWKSTAALALGGTAFILFLLTFFLDSLVLALAPAGYMIDVL